MSTHEFMQMAKEEVAKYYNEVYDGEQMNAEDVFIVWMCKTLQNCKALLGWPKGDGMYFEVTYNGDKNQMYIDAYVKQKNIFKQL